MSAREKRSAWQQVTPGDRRLLHSLLAALPSMTAQAHDADGAQIVLSGSEKRALIRLAADARRAMSPPRLRRWVRRWAAAWRGR
jgi:hypothetical protein